VGNLFYVGELRPEDNGVLVRRVGRLSSDDLRGAIAVLLSEHGKTQVQADGLVIVGDRVEVLQRVDDLLTRIDAAESVCWVVQLYLISMSDGDILDLGLDVTPALEVAATMASASNGLDLVPKTSLKGGLNVVLRAARERSSVSLVGEPLFLLADGARGRVGSGQRVPVVQRAVSNQGTVTTTGYQFIDTGLQINVLLRELSAGAARLELKAESSSVLEYRETLPILQKDDFEGTAVISSGGVYLVGSLERTAHDKRQTSPFRIAAKDSEQGQVLQIWARAYRVGGPVGSACRSAPAQADEPAGR
jgi:type II secretory pathway component GspD/PulD (secretin)